MSSKERPHQDVLLDRLSARVETLTSSIQGIYKILDQCLSLQHDDQWEVIGDKLFPGTVKGRNGGRYDVDDNPFLSHKRYEREIRTTSLKRGQVLDIFGRYLSRELDKDESRILILGFRRPRRKSLLNSMREVMENFGETNVKKLKKVSMVGVMEKRLVREYDIIDGQLFYWDMSTPYSRYYVGSVSEEHVKKFDEMSNR